MTAIKKQENGVAAVPAAEVQAVLQRILASDMFCNAPRMCRLLRFLVDKAIAGAVRDTNEYAIGIEVFDRDPSVYSASEDPIVRVQVGRLREKLKTYYSNQGIGSDIVISIPIGSYMPIIQKQDASAAEAKQQSMLAVHPFKCISHHGEALPFTQGLDEELKHQLFKVFGKVIVPDSFFKSGDANNDSWSLKNISSVGVNHLLEGSIQLDSERIRASIRLVDVSVGCIAWSEQFDRDAFFAISQQEELASSICGSLKHFFCHN
jgi:TolB-like protein